MLQAWELMDLKLKAGLAVLSACETGRGRIGNGEGLVGMSWAFFVAGCPSVISSQWKVSSIGGKEQMIRLHQYLVNGDTKARALQKAALEVRNTTLLDHPYYWTAFVLIGHGN